MMRTAEDKLGYAWTEATRFRLSIEVGGVGRPATLSFRDLKTLEEAQLAYVEARDVSERGVSTFSEGVVRDETGQHVATVSCNGRLWPPGDFHPGAPPVAEAPARQAASDDGHGDDLVWMVGTREGALNDAWTAGPDNSPEILKLGMQEGGILVGKDRRGDVRVVRKMGPGGLVDVPGGLDTLRPDAGPAP